MRRHHDARAIGNLGRLVRRRGRLAFHRRFRLDDFERHAGGQLNGNRHAVEQRQNDLHAFLQPLGLITENVFRHLQLLKALVIHEVEAFAVLIEEGEVAIFHESALDLFGRLVAVRRLHAIGQAAHVDLGRGRALAGMEAFGGQNNIELSVLALDNIALADRTGDDFHGNDSSRLMGGPWQNKHLPAELRACIAILPASASP